MIGFKYGFLAVVPTYETDVPKKYVLSGNDVIFSCQLPSHVADFLGMSHFQPKSVFSSSCRHANCNCFILTQNAKEEANCFVFVFPEFKTLNNKNV